MELFLTSDRKAILESISEKGIRPFTEMKVQKYYAERKGFRVE
jgi:hypothetical protein